MRIPSVTSTLSGSHTHPAAPSGHVVDSQIDALAHTDDVLLHQDSQEETCSALPLDTLLMLIQGILEAAGCPPLHYSDALRIDSALAADTPPPQWFVTAEHKLACTPSSAARLCAIGAVMTEPGHPQAFVLELQLLNHLFSCPPSGLQGRFVLSPHAGLLAGKQVSFSLRNTSWVTEGEAVPAQMAYTATPLFAQFSFVSQPDILCVAARLLPPEQANVLRPRPASGDGSYVAMEELEGRSRLVDVSA